MKLNYNFKLFFIICNFDPSNFIITFNLRNFYTINFCVFVLMVMLLMLIIYLDDFDMFKMNLLKYKHDYYLKHCSKSSFIVAGAGEAVGKDRWRRSSGCVRGRWRHGFDKRKTSVGEEERL